MFAHVLACLALTVPSFASELAPSDPAWIPTLEEAFALVGEERRCVYLHVTREGERMSRFLLDRLLHDEEIVQATEAFACVLAVAADDGVEALELQERTFSKVTREQARAVWRAARDRWLGPTADGRARAPSSYFLSKDGEVLLAAHGWVTRAQLLWLFAEANALAGGGSNVRPASDRPKTGPANHYVLSPFTTGRLELVFGKVEGEPPGQTRVAALRELLASPHPRALAYVREQLQAPWADPVGAKYRKRMVHAIGSFAHPAYESVLLAWVSDANASVRDQAIVALEQLGSPAVVKPLLAQWRGESDDLVRKNLLRALAACGSTDKAVQRLVVRSARSEKDEVVRANALIAVASLAPHGEVTRTLERTLGSRVERDRQAASLGIGRTLDERFIAAVETARDKAKSEAERTIHEGVLLVLRSEAPPESLDEWVEAIAQDQTPRGRIFGHEVR